MCRPIGASSFGSRTLGFARLAAMMKFELMCCSFRVSQLMARLNQALVAAAAGAASALAEAQMGT